MKSINLYLTFLLFLALTGFSPGPFKAQAKDLVIEELPDFGQMELGDLSGPLFLELFSSQACVFCPKAELFLADLLQLPNVIGVSCHVDYFDVKETALSQPYCTERQSWYMGALRAGPNYTPQLVVNGHLDAVGHKGNDVISKISMGSRDSMLTLDIENGEAPDQYLVRFPPDDLMKEGADSVLWLMAYDKPHELTIAGGRNKGRKMTYNNIVSGIKQLEMPEHISDGVSFTLPLAEGQKGFVVLLQDPKEGTVLALGEYIK